MSQFLQHRPFCLASSSPRRQMLLKKYGLKFECHSPQINETPYENETAKSFVKRMSREKASEIQRSFPELPHDVIILAGDTIVFFDDKILGKPENTEHAHTMLRASLLLLFASSVNASLYSENISMALDFTPGANASRLYGSEGVGDRMFSILRSKPVTMNNHHGGIEPSAMAANARLAKFFNVLSTNKDRVGRPFVSSMEAKDAAGQPVYGTQYHPEKNNFEFGVFPNGSVYEAINHSPDAVAVSQAEASFFVGEARLNSHRYASKAAEAAALIYNFETTKTEESFVETC